MRSDPVTIRRHLDDMRVAGLSDTYIQHRRRAIVRLERRCGRPVLLITAQMLDDWQRTIPGTASTRAQEILHARAVYRWAVRRRLLRTDPSRLLVIPKRPTRVPRPASEAELADALDNAPARLLPWLLLMSVCGLRCCEVARLDRADILDRADPAVVILRGKGGRQRIVPLSPAVLAALRDLPARGAAFPRRDGRPGHLSPGQVSTLVNRYLHSVGVQASAHRLRHRAGTRAYQHSRDIRMVQTFLGHTTPAVTAGYAAHSPTAMRDAVLALDPPRRILDEIGA